MNQVMGAFSKHYYQMWCYGLFNGSHSVYPKWVGMFSEFEFSTWISRLGIVMLRRVLRVQKKRIKRQRTKTNRERQLQHVVMYTIQKKGFITFSRLCFVFVFFFFA